MGLTPVVTLPLIASQCNEKPYRPYKPVNPKPTPQPETPNNPNENNESTDGTFYNKLSGIKISYPENATTYQLMSSPSAIKFYNYDNYEYHLSINGVYEYDKNHAIVEVIIPINELKKQILKYKIQTADKTEEEKLFDNEYNNIVAIDTPGWTARELSSPYKMVDIPTGYDTSKIKIEYGGNIYRVNSKTSVARIPIISKTNSYISKYKCFVIPTSTSIGDIEWNSTKEWAKEASKIELSDISNYSFEELENNYSLIAIKNHNPSIINPKVENILRIDDNRALITIVINGKNSLLPYTRMNFIKNIADDKPIEYKTLINQPL